MTTATVQMGIDYPVGMTREQAIATIAPAIGEYANVMEEAPPYEQDGRIYDVILIDVPEALWERIEEEGEWEAAIGAVRIQAETP